MSGERFTIDANVLFYALDLEQGVRHHLAADIVERAARANCVLMAQALGELFHAASRKGLMPRDEAAAQVRDWIQIFPVAAAAPSAMAAAVDAAARGMLSLWDAHLLASANEAGCAVAISESMADGASFAGVAVRHPFAGNRLAPAIEALLA